MNLHQYLKAISYKKQTIASVLIAFLAVAILASAVQPFKYGSSFQLLTVHTLKETTDPYIASKSNEYLSNLLAKIVSSNSFFEKIKSSGFNIDENYFRGSDRKVMKKWGQTVKAKGIGDTGIIAIEVYHTDRAQAEEIARAVAFVLETNHSQYHGFGKNVEIKEIDKPITSSLPVKPNVLLNLGLAVIFAFLFSLFYIYLFPEEKYNIRLWGNKKSARKESVPAAEYNAAPEEVRGYLEEENYPSIENYENRGDINNVLKR